MAIASLSLLTVVEAVLAWVDSLVEGSAGGPQQKLETRPAAVDLLVFTRLFWWNFTRWSDSGESIDVQLGEGWELEQVPNIYVSHGQPKLEFLL